MLDPAVLELATRFCEAIDRRLAAGELTLEDMGLGFAHAFVHERALVIEVLGRAMQQAIDDECRPEALERLFLAPVPGVAGPTYPERSE